MSLVPNVSANVYTISAFAIGYILIDSNTPAEQNSLGSWFMLIGQTLCSNSAQQQVINNRTIKPTQQNQHIINDSFGGDFSNIEVNEQIKNMNKVITAMKKEIEYLQKKLHLM